MLMLERWVESLLFASRWLLAPVYLGLSLALLALGVKFFQEGFHVLSHVLDLRRLRSAARRAGPDGVCLAPRP
jgi:uncharacterized protein (TIGR00645 family)